MAVSRSDRPLKGDPRSKRRPAASRPSGDWLPERVKLWWYFGSPLLVLALLVVAVYAAFRYSYERKEPSTAMPSTERLDLSQPQAGARLMERYIAARGGATTHRELVEAEHLIYNGLLLAEDERHLFEIVAEPMQSLEIEFSSEGASVDFAWVAQAPLLTGAERAGERLVRRALVLAELTGGFLDPLYTVAAQPDQYRIDHLSRTQWRGFPVIAVDVVSTTDPGRRATVFVDEAEMQTVAVETRLHSKTDRTYRYFTDLGSDQGLMPDEVSIQMGPAAPWVVRFQRIRPVQRPLSAVADVAKAQ